MLLGYFTEEAYERLLNDSENNVSNYTSDEDWLPRYFGRGVTYFGLSSKEVGEFSPYCSFDGKESDNDLVNARNIYEALKLTPLQASNKYMWAYLCHCVPKYRKYIQTRWKDSPTKYRYFVPNGQDGLYYFNALSRLWWCAHLTYDENSRDHYALTKILFDNQMVGKDFLGTFNGKNYNRMKGVLLALNEFKEICQPREGIQKYFRECNKILNQQAAITMLDFLSIEEIKELAYNILVSVRQSMKD